MTCNVVLSVKFVENELKLVKIDIDLQGKVRVLREHASKITERPAEELELIFDGITLDDDSTLASYNVKNGRIIYILPKIIRSPPTPPRQITDGELQRFLSAFEKYGHRIILQKFSRQDVMDKILASAPNLIADPAAIALLQDTELLLLFADPNVLRKILDAHPLLVDALPLIITFLSENPPPNSSQSSAATGYSYSLEALSDDEDIDNDTQSREGHSLTRNSSFNAITATQLAAAIANATTTYSSTGAIENSTPPASGSIITNEMFGNALQQAFATSSSSPAATIPSSGAVAIEEESLESLRTRLEPQLQQMRDMGLTNETQNIRALQVTSGDVQAAIEFVFGSDIDMSF